MRKNVNRKVVTYVASLVENNVVRLISFFVKSGDIVDITHSS